MRTQRLGKDALGRWWGFWVISPQGESVYIGKIRAASDAQFIRNSTTQDHFNFIENWHHESYNNCSEVPDAMYYVYSPRFNGNGQGATRSGINETNCVDVVELNNRTKLEIGL